MSADPYSTPEATSGVRVQTDTWQKPNWKSLLFSFDGRIPRSLYWIVYLISMGGSIVPIVAISALLTPLLIRAKEAGSDAPPAAAMGIIFLVLFSMSIPLMWISLATACKRWHDRGKSGWMSLISLIPFVGGIWFLVEVGCLPGDTGPNQYGPDPLG